MVSSRIYPALVLLCVILTSAAMLFSYHSDRLTIIAVLLAVACALIARRGLRRTSPKVLGRTPHITDNLPAADTDSDDPAATVRTRKNGFWLSPPNLTNGTVLVAVLAGIFAGIVSIAAATVVADKGGGVAWIISVLTVVVGAGFAAATGAVSMTIRPRTRKAMVTRIACASGTGAAIGRWVSTAGCAMFFNAVPTFAGVAIASAASAVAAVGGVVALTLASIDVRAMLDTALDRPNTVM